MNLQTDIYELRTEVIQPTSMCNIECQYCYLGDKLTAQKMGVDLASRLAQGLDSFQSCVNLVWHGGEPLMAGIRSLTDLLMTFESRRQAGFLRHALQTNATLIDEDWCDLFRHYDIRVGISLDGPEWANTRPLDRRNRPTFRQVLKGMEHLQRARVPFSIICVVTSETVSRAHALYDFFRELGCRSLAINIVERDGNAKTPIPTREDVSKFWKELFDAWWKTPTVEIREFRRVVSWLEHTLNGDQSIGAPPGYDWTATVDLNGNVRVLSPELSAVKSAQFGDFIVGNVRSKSLDEILRGAINSHYVEQFVAGRRECEKSCGYFSFCRGGQASNKFAETGTFEATETTYCINAKKVLVDTTIAQLLEHSIGHEKGERDARSHRQDHAAH